MYFHLFIVGLLFAACLVCAYAAGQIHRDMQHFDAQPPAVRHDHQHHMVLCIAISAIYGIATALYLAYLLT